MASSGSVDEVVALIGMSCETKTAIERSQVVLHNVGILRYIGKGEVLDHLTAVQLGSQTRVGAS